MAVSIQSEALTQAAFAPFGDVLEAAGAPDMVINAGTCQRFHDRARLDMDAAGRTGISLFQTAARSLPYTFAMVERHPLGAQAFIPMQAAPYLVIVAPDIDGTPGLPRAFIAAPGQGVNYHCGTWHGVLAPLSQHGVLAPLSGHGVLAPLSQHGVLAPEPGTDPVLHPEPRPDPMNFAVIDWIGKMVNLEEFWFDTQYVVEP